MTRSGLTHHGRTLMICSWLQLRMLLQFRFYVAAIFIQPVALALISFLMLRHGHTSDALARVAVHTGLMGMWTATLFGSGGALRRERAFGTLEHTFITTTPLAVTILAISLATAFMGLVSMAVTLLTGGLLFGLPVFPHDPIAFVGALAVGTAANACLGFLLATAFVLYRNSSVLTNLLEYPIWILAGFLVPVSTLPEVWRPISNGLSMHWASQALGTAFVGGAFPWREIAWCAAVGLGYLVLALLTLRKVENAARRHATLSLV